MQMRSAAALLILAFGLVHTPLSLGAPSKSVKSAPQKNTSVVYSTTNLARTVFQSLLGEFALGRGELKLSVDTWSDLAQRTRDPAVIERATEVAGISRQYERALGLTQLWLEVAPESIKAKQMRSSLLAILGRFDELGLQLADVFEEDKENLANNLLQINSMFFRQADKKAVQKLVDQIASAHQDLPEAHYAMAQAAANAGDDVRALDEIEKALALRPSWEIAALTRAQLQARKSNALAINGLNDYLERDPTSRNARLGLVRLLLAEKKYDDARKQLDRLLKAHPDNPEIIYVVAILALQQGDTETGKVQLEKLLKTNFADKSTVHFFLGQLYQEQKKLDESLQHYKQVEGGNQYLSARFRSAQILQQQGKIDEARKLLQETSVSDASERTQLIMVEAQLLRDAGQPNSSYIMLETALSNDPDNQDLLYETALAAERAGNLELLEKHLRHLIALKPDHAHALNALGYSFAERNVRLSEAHSLITQALSLLPDNPFITDSLGWVLFKQGKLKEALETLENAYKLRADPEIAAHIGEVLWTMNRKDEAKKILQQAQKEHPENEALKSTIKKLIP